MRRAWYPSGSWKTGRPYHIPNILRGSPRFCKNGNLTARRKITAHLRGSHQLGREKESHQTGNSIFGGVAAARHQGGQAREVLCLKNVYHGSQGKGAGLLYQAYQRISIRSVIVAYIPGQLEWLKPATERATSVTGGAPYSNRCLGIMGLWLLLPWFVVSMAMAIKLVNCFHNGQGACTNPHKLCSLVKPPSKTFSLCSSVIISAWWQPYQKVHPETQMSCNSLGAYGFL